MCVNLIVLSLRAQALGSDGAQFFAEQNGIAPSDVARVDAALSWSDVSWHNSWGTASGKTTAV